MLRMLIIRQWNTQWAGMYMSASYFVNAALHEK